MGMAASQARFLSLTARKTNVEYEGQQVNQQRTMLSNQSANYYNDLLGMSVPVPPSVEDYTKTVYTFTDGALTNTVSSLVAKSNGLYSMSYVSSWTDDFTPVALTSHVVTKVGDDKEAEELYESFINGTAGGCYTHLHDTSDDVRTQLQISHIAHVINHMLGPGTYTTSEGKSLSIGTDKSTPINNVYWTKPTSDGYGGDAATMSDIASKLKGKPIAQKLIDLLYNTRQVYNGPSADITIDVLNSLRNQLDEIIEGDLKKSLNSSYIVGKDTLRDLGIIDVSYDSYGNVNGYYGNDEYLKTLSYTQLKQTIQQEKEYEKLLDEKYGNSSWMIRYVLNASTNEYEPEFYDKDTLQNAVYNNTNDGNVTSIRCYKMGSDKKTEEIKNVEARLEQDTSGRIINVTLYPEQVNQVTYAVSTSTVTDQAKYDDAMNQYEYNKAKYSQAIQEINSKIEIIQTEDKNVELRLKQLDTEQKAIQTEMEAVQKVIEKNTESTFKTFG